MVTTELEQIVSLSDKLALMNHANLYAYSLYIESELLRANQQRRRLADKDAPREERADIYWKCIRPLEVEVERVKWYSKRLEHPLES